MILNYNKKIRYHHKNINKIDNIKISYKINNDIYESIYQFTFLGYIHIKQFIKNNIIYKYIIYDNKNINGINKIYKKIKMLDNYIFIYNNSSIIKIFNLNIKNQNVALSNLLNAYDYDYINLTNITNIFFLYNYKDKTKNGHIISIFVYLKNKRFKSKYIFNKKILLDLNVIRKYNKYYNNKIFILI